MNLPNRLLALAAAAIVPFTFTPLGAQGPQGLPAAGAVNVNDTARFLAGLPPLADPALIELSQEKAWQRHTAIFNLAWAQLEESRLAKVRRWSWAHNPDAATAEDTLFYMFSGPDFLYADTFFPKATTYVLCGIEPVGPIPDLSGLRRDQLGHELQALRSTLDSVFSFSFFITKEMKNDLQGHTLRGTLPVLAIFLARSGKTICDAGFVGIDKQGALSPIAQPVRSADITAVGVRINFLSPGSDTPRTLYYFSTDISDSGLKGTGFLNFCQTLAPGNGLVKSASYLMHESYFSTIRGFLLDHSRTLVQDDSGIPCSLFVPERWQLRLFGSYPGPIPLFKNYTQPDLAELYRTSAPVPLDFGIGYRHRTGESTLMVAARRTEEAPPKAVPVAIPVADAQFAPVIAPAPIIAPTP